MNAAEALLGAGEPAAPALICGEDAVSYAQLSDRVARVAGYLTSAGIEPGDRVLLAAADGVDWVAAHLGTMWAGAVSVPLNPQMSNVSLQQTVRESGARLLLVDRHMASGIDERSLAGLAHEDAIEAHSVAPETPALWVYSSGTTSGSKAVVHAHRAITGCAAFAREVLGAGPRDRFHASSKLFFAYPLANSLYAGLALGACVILDARWPDAAGTVATALEQQATILFSVPTLYHAMLKSGHAARLRGSGVSRFVSAGESLPAAVAESWHAATGRGIFGGYGMSETLALVLYRDERRDQDARPAPLAQVRADAGSNPGAPHRLWFRHPSVALGYHQRPELERENFRDGWCSAGDLFHEPVPGRYLFAGRAGDWVKVSGRWVSVLELEAQFADQCLDSVRELALAAVPGAEGLSAIALFAVPTGADRAAAAAAIERAGARLPTHQRPRWVHWVDALPRTASGKLARAGLHALHVQRIEQNRSEEET